MSYEMTGKEYSLLYKRYLQKGTKSMFRYARRENVNPANKLFTELNYLDLCCGSNGICVQEAVRQGIKNVTFVDLNPEIGTDLGLNGQLRDNPNVLTHTPYVGEVKHFVSGLYHSNSSSMVFWPDKGFDLVTCRQGINYWFDPEVLRQLCVLMNYDGVFVFNTFWKEPSVEPKVKEYEIDGIQYKEVSLLKGTTVYHSQYAGGMQPHHTSFEWIPFERIIRACNSTFSNVSAFFEGNSVYIRCQVN